MSTQKERLLALESYLHGIEAMVRAIDETDGDSDAALNGLAPVIYREIERAKALVAELAGGAA